MSLLQRRSNHVIVINLHGGIPNCYIEALLNRWSCVKHMMDIGCDVMTNVYTSNACAASAFGDIILDAPIASVTDAGWHSWSHVRNGHRTLFHAMKDAGYRTRLMGAFGLDPKLDPHRIMRCYPTNVESALKYMGIDDYDTEDATFTCRTAASHDAGVLERLYTYVTTWRSQDRHFCVVNLLACQDVHRLSWRDEPSFVASVPTVDYKTWTHQCAGCDTDDDECALTHDIVLDDARRCEDHTDKLRRVAMLYDYLRGDRCEAPSKERIEKILKLLHRSSWSAMNALDVLLIPIIKVLTAMRASITLTSDHPLALYEHGSMCETPWEVCTRTFVVRCDGYTQGRGTPYHVDEIVSLTTLSSMVIETSSHVVDWHTCHCPIGTLTLSISPSSLCRAFVDPVVNVFNMKAFWVRVVLTESSRTFALTFWWSLDDMVHETIVANETRNSNAQRKRQSVSVAKSMSEWEQLTMSERADRLSQSHSWRLPVTDTSCVSSVFEITTDVHELSDIWTPDWAKTRIFTTVWSKVQNILAHYGLTDDVTIRYPPFVHDMVPETVALCSIQVQPQTRHRPCPDMRSVYVQTETAVHFPRDHVLTAQHLVSSLPTPSPSFHPLLPEQSSTPQPQHRAVASTHLRVHPVQDALQSHPADNVNLVQSSSTSGMGNEDTLAYTARQAGTVKAAPRARRSIHSLEAGLHRAHR